MTRMTKKTGSGPGPGRCATNLIESHILLIPLKISLSKLFRDFYLSYLDSNSIAGAGAGTVTMPPAAAPPPGPGRRSAGVVAVVVAAARRRRRGIRGIMAAAAAIIISSESSAGLAVRRLGNLIVTVAKVGLDCHGDSVT